MKRLILILLLPAIPVLAQKPEPIYPFARHEYSESYLREQSALWKKETRKKPANANAWYNYYYANRNLYFADKTESGREQQSKRIAALIDEMEKAIPETYEYHLCRWLERGWDMTRMDHLKKAQAIGPDRPEHLDFSIVLAEIDDDKNARDRWSQKKYDAGQFSTGLIYYNYNVLAGLPQNALLLTSGDNDTYPVWYLQSKGVRPDVTIIHTQLIHLKEYRQAVLGKLKIEAWEGNSPPWKHVQTDESKYNIVTWLNERTDRPLYVALSASPKTRSAPAENMYLTGLAFAYSKKPVDNVAMLRRNFEQIYALDYLDRSFFPDISEELVKTVNGNYVVPMLKLLEHYHASGDTFQAQRIRRLLLAVVKGTDAEQEVIKKLDGI